MADLDRERAGFSIDVPARFNAVVNVLDRWAGEDAGAVALVSLDGAGGLVASQTVAELVAESRRAARALAGLGVAAGERLLVMLPRVPAWYAAVLGAIRIGAIPMPGPGLLTPRDIAYRVDRGGAVAVVADAGAPRRSTRAAPSAPRSRTGSAGRPAGSRARAGTTSTPCWSRWATAPPRPTPRR